MIASISFPSGKFRVKYSLAFTSKLGEIADRDSECATQITNLMDEVERNPHNPAIVRRCYSITPDNEVFKYRVCRNVIAIWQVACRLMYSTKGEDWTIEFARLEDV